MWKSPVSVGGHEILLMLLGAKPSGSINRTNKYVRERFGAPNALHNIARINIDDFASPEIKIPSPETVLPLTFQVHLFYITIERNKLL